MRFAVESKCSGLGEWSCDEDCSRPLGPGTDAEFINLGSMGAVVVEGEAKLIADLGVDHAVAHR